MGRSTAALVFLKLVLVAALLVLACTAAGLILVVLSARVGFASALVVVVGGLVLVLRRVARRGRAKRAHVNELPPI